MLRVLFKMLRHTENRALAIKSGGGVYKYYSEAKFVVDCFDELTVEEIFR